MAFGSLPTIGIITVVSFVGGLLAILDYFRYIPDIAVMAQNPSEFLTIHRKFIRSYQFKRFWAPIVKNDDMIVVFPAKDLDDHREGTHKFDHMGLQELVNGLHSNFRGLEFDSVPDDQLSNIQKESNNIITVAGPIPNQVAYQLLYDSDIPLKFEKLSTGKIINTVISNNDRIKLEPDTYYDESEDEVKCRKDYGIITVAPNPYNKNKVIVNAAGGYGEGTRAGCRLLTMPTVLSRLNKEGGKYFQAYYSVDIDQNGDLQTPEIIGIWKLDPDSQ